MPHTSSTHILVIDNYDSFTYNLVQYLAQLGAHVTVRRNDALTQSEVEGLASRDTAALDGAAVHGVLLSPGPGAPEDSGVCLSLLQAAQSSKNPTPTLGVCLGHQALAYVWGAVIERAPQLLHGKTSEVKHTETGVFRDLPNPLTATRYHSLSIRRGTLSPELQITAEVSDGTIMGIEHVTKPLFGVQFHPESILTHAGHSLLQNWLSALSRPGTPS